MRNTVKKLSLLRLLYPGLIALFLIMCGCTKKSETFEVLDTEPDALFDLREDEEALEESAAKVSEDEEPLIVVHICGAVVSGGVYSLPSGSRVIDAVNAAGGFLDEADQTAVNLAKGLADGIRLKIPTVEEASLEGAYFYQDDPGFDAADVNEGSVSSRVNINTATKEELITVNGIGPARADDIITYREQHGKFVTIEDIMKVPGIKQGLFAKIKDRIMV